ncbi:hypothetical protein QYM36_008452 [Artemia franciscana]|uniref:Uncharacterized protein n=1 Tax=Artemia franciscana TaxID=6661 RepID=A0AA88LI55_ARTSF|nr:hypothetical protein QYM36_008452 [Artemia franciscana]
MWSPAVSDHSFKLYYTEFNTFLLGGGLTDVSIFMMMPNLELLALSVNNLESLSDLKGCRNLQELYLRKNNIKDLREVCHLKNLKHLKNLWLADNPCAETDSYRLSVLRTLPQLQVLDDVQVQKQELQEAFAKGKELKLPDEDSDENSPSSQVKTNPELDIPEEVQATPKNDCPRVLTDADSSKEMLLQSSTVSKSTTKSDISKDALESFNTVTNDIPPKETLPHQVSTMFISPGQVRPKRLQEPEELRSRPQNMTPDDAVPLRKSSSPSKSKNLQISQDISSWRQSLAELHPELQDQECGALNEQTIERAAEMQGCDSRYQHANARSCPIQYVIVLFL